MVGARPVVAMLAGLLAMMPSLAWPNGGPVQWSGVGVAGSIAPRSGTSVQLESERLLITLSPDGDTYSAHATYQVRNDSGVPVSVTYGVPLLWIDSASVNRGGLEGGELPVGQRELGYPESVDIRIGGKRAPCKMSGARRAVESEHPFVPEGYGWNYVEAWCLAEIVVPGGRSKISLKYPGTLIFLDSDNSSKPLLYREVRKFEYRLDPASAWEGRPRSLDVVFDAGVWANRVEFLKPLGWRREGSRFLLRVETPNLKQLAVIGARVRSNEILTLRELLAKKPVGQWTVQSGTGSNEDARPAPELTDGRLDTTWCLGSAASRWAEFRAIADGTCSLVGLALVPEQDEADVPAYPHGTDVKVEIEPCGGGPLVREVHGPLAPTHSTFLDLVDFDYRPLFKWLDDPSGKEITRVCIRLTLKRDGPKATEPICISEIRPFLHCRRLGDLRDTRRD